MIAAEAHTPLSRVRKKLEETFGQFDLIQTPEPHSGNEEERFVSTFSEAIRKRRLVEIEYQKEGEESSSTRVVEPYSLERELPNWRVHTWDRTRDGERSRHSREKDSCFSAPFFLRRATHESAHRGRDVLHFAIERRANCTRLAPDFRGQGRDRTSASRVAAVLLTQIGIDDGFDLTAGRRFRDCSCHPRSHLLKAVGQRLDDKIILALEVAIETAVRHLQRLHELTDTHAGTRPPETARRSFNDALSRLLFLLGWISHVHWMIYVI